MSTIPMPDEAELYLIAFMDDASGIDLAELCWHDEAERDRCFRVRDYQWNWWLCDDTYQADRAGRNLGKTYSILARAFAHAFKHPGADMLITAPELNHLRPLTDAIESRLLSCRLSREMLPMTKGHGIARQPHWQARFLNGAKIVSRLPNKDGRGVKGSVIAGSLVTTPRGHVPIESIREGDRVLSDQGRWRRVLKAYSYEADVVAVAGAGHREMIVSTNHRLLARRNANPQRTRNLGLEQWCMVEDPEMPQRWYWASPNIMPRMRVPLPPNGGSASEWWLIGRYLADGNLQTGGVPVNGKRKLRAVGLTAAVDRIEEIEAIARLAGYKPHRREHENAAATNICHTPLAQYLLEHFGHHADGKRLPVWVHSLPGADLLSLLEGYQTADGHYDPQRDRWTMGTASKELAVGLRLVGNQLGYTTSFSWVDVKPNAGCEPLRSWRVTWTTRGHALHEGGHAWQRIRSVEPAGTAVVCDLVVEEDESYVADALVQKGGL